MATRKDRTRNLAEDIEWREVAIEVLKEVAPQTPRRQHVIRNLRKEIGEFKTLLSWERANMAPAHR